MSRTSRVPYHQNVYDLLLIDPRPLDGAEELILAWEKQTGFRFPRAMTEFYSTQAVVPSGINGSEPWTLSLVDVWHEYSNMGPPNSLIEVLDHRDRPERVESEVEPGPYFRLQTENQGCWLLYARLSGEDDPPTYATDGGLFFRRQSNYSIDDEWVPLARFTDMIFDWFAYYYHALEAEIGSSFVPLTFMSYRADPEMKPLAPPKPYVNGLWLRTPDEPFQPPVIDFLIDHFGEPQCTPRPCNVTTYTYRPPGGTIRITADDPSLTGGLSAWWIHAETAERLEEFARLLLPWGTLRDTLRADTDPAREVLRGVRESLDRWPNEC